MVYKIAVLPGDGIGPEVMTQGLRVLQAVSEKYNLDFSYQQGLIGGDAVDKLGSPFPEETQELVKKSDAVLLGAVGGPKWDGLSPEKRPERGLLAIRKALGLYANLRPVKSWPQLVDQSPLKNEKAAGVDLLIVRELIGGAYFGSKGEEKTDAVWKAFDTIEYSDEEVRRVANVAFELAEQRNKKLTSVDKANVLTTSRLWRSVIEEEAKKHPQTSVNHLYVDNCAMQICLNPAQFDVIVTENMFGDILSDQASVIGASLGMLPSASIGQGASLYEPAHGSAPEIAGKNTANPLAMILSTAMFLRQSVGNSLAAQAIEGAVNRVLDEGYRTADIWVKKGYLIGTEEMGLKVIQELDNNN